jgi:gamma-glutamyltranspeptidase/glutathione hydrolase
MAYVTETTAQRVPDRDGEPARTLGIAAPQRSAAEAGTAAFQAGGNAFDAALAAALSLTVTYPADCSLGGDLIALVRRADGTRTVINASGPAPAAVDVEAVRGLGPAMPVAGAAPVTVPGMVAGLRAIWSFGAVRPWAAAFDVAIEQAEGGTALAPSVAEAIEECHALVAADPGLREAFLPDGAPPAPGTVLRQPALARTLRSLADDPGALHRGAIGASLVRCLQEHGSAMTTADLEAFVVDEVAPLCVHIGDQELATAPPNSQGFSLARILTVAFAIDPEFDPLGPDAARLAAIFRDATSDRDRHLADPRFADVPVAELMDPHRDRPEPFPSPERGHGDTVAVVCVDDAGNSVSLIQSLFHAFGSGIRDPETGITLHNRGASFSLDPQSPNVLAPGKRPAHTLTPCTLFDAAGRPAIVLGTMGGSGQPQILSQVLMHLRRTGDPTAAVSLPRWVVGGMGADTSREELLVESRVPEVARRALAETAFPVTPLKDFDHNVGHAQLVTLAGDGAIMASSDPRSEGAAMVASR